MHKMKKMLIVLEIIGVIVVIVLLFIGQPSFGGSPKGARLERIKQSKNWKEGEFRNAAPTQFMTSGKHPFTAMFEFITGDKSGLTPDKPVEAIKSDLHALSSQEDYIVWFGHSSYLMQLGGKRFLVDPVFYKASPVSFVNKPFKGTDIYRPADMPDIDYLIITHDHWDHLDYQAVTEMRDRVGKVICPLGVGAHFERWEYPSEKIIELDWNENADFPCETKIACLPSRHFSGRGLKRNQTLWAAFMLQTSDHCIFIGGDGGYGPNFQEIGKQFPNIDLAILENGQYNQDWKYIHTMPEYLMQEVEDLHPRQVLTVHHLKYALSHHKWDEPLQNEEQLSNQSKTSIVLRPHIGEIVKL